MSLSYDFTAQRESASVKPNNPEHELLVAILDRAVLDFYSRRDALRGPAQEWLFEAEEDDGMFSFEWICQHLGLDSEAVRKRVAELQLSSNFAQSHRWLRKKVQSGKKSAAENDDEFDEEAAA